MSAIHDYFKYDVPVEVGIFLDETKQDVISLLKAERQETMKIISDQGSVMTWSVLYTLDSIDTVLLTAHYRQSNICKYFTFYHMGNAICNGNIRFFDNNEQEVRLIQMKRSYNGKWMTTNQVLVAAPANYNIIKAVD